MSRDDPVVVADLGRDEAAHVVSLLRLRLLPATENEAVLRRFERTSRVVTREAFNRLAPQRQLVLLLAVFDELGVGEAMRARAEAWAAEWRSSHAGRAAEHAALTRF